MSGARFQPYLAEIYREAMGQAERETADLSDRDFRSAFAEDEDLSSVDLSRAVLRDAQLRRACLKSAVLREADLRGADLRRVDFFEADLTGADLTGARLWGASLMGAQIGGVRGLSQEAIAYVFGDRRAAEQLAALGLTAPAAWECGPFEHSLHALKAWRTWWSKLPLEKDCV